MADIDHTRFRVFRGLASLDSLLYWLLALALIRGILYAALVPPWQAPDEPAQFERARAALSAQDWNSTSDNGPAWYGDLIKSLFTFNFWDFVDENRPEYSPDGQLNQYIAPYHEVYGGLYGSRTTYALMGWPVFLARQQDITLQLYLVRLYTVLMNLGIIVLAYLTTRQLFPGNSFLILGVPILILFNPQHTHLLSTVNNGNLAELLATAALYFLVRGMIRDFAWLDILLSLGLSLVAMWTKATAYFLMIAFGLVVLFYLWSYRRYWRWALLLVGLGAVPIYFLLPARLKQLMLWAWEGARAGQLYLDPIVPRDLFNSFWAMPGWFIVRLHPIWYQLLAAGCILAGIGLIIFLVTRWKFVLTREYQPRVKALIVLAVAIVVAISVLLIWNVVTNTVVYRQGRSIYPVIVPIYLFLLLGWQQFIPGRWRDVGLLAITMGALLFDSLVLFHYTVPLFYSRY